MICHINTSPNSDGITNIEDLSVYNWGYEECKKGHYFGPAVRDHYLIHYILRGRGNFQIGDRNYSLEGGQGFLICPSLVTFYQADLEDPWHYAWVGFGGQLADHYLDLSALNPDNPIFSYSVDDYMSNCLLKMNQMDNFSEAGSAQRTGLLYLFLGKLIEINTLDASNESTKDAQEIYVDRAIQYIERNYSRNLTISMLSDYIGIDRKYLCQLFNEYLNTTPQQYLIDYRVDRASHLLRDTNLYVGDIARSVGYNDPLQFSKMFKKVKGISPKHYRDELIR